VDVFDINTFVD